MGLPRPRDGYVHAEQLGLYLLLLPGVDFGQGDFGTGQVHLHGDEGHLGLDEPAAEGPLLELQLLAQVGQGDLG